VDVTLASMSTTARRVTVIAHELRGFLPVGGMGTATAFLALALARQGHSVEILLGKHSLDSIDPQWETAYRHAGVRFRAAPPSDDPVEPWEFERGHNVERGLRADPPDVVIAHDFGAPAYSALRLRQAGLGFENTLFVVFCHGPRRYVLDLSPTLALGDLQTVLSVSVLEQACVELADVVVSPSMYLVDWMRAQAWQLPERTRVIPYFTGSAATGESISVATRPDSDPLRRLAFFGRVDEKKGVRPFAAALNALEPERLRGLELEFIGKTTATWTRERTESLLSETTRRALGDVVFETELDQQQALARLSRPGTLAVMPSLQENSPNTVYECLELGIPFIASNVGGVPELIAPDDRARVLFEPTADGVEAALRVVLDDGHVPPPARPAFEPSASTERWAEVIEMRPNRAPATETAAGARVDVVLVPRSSNNGALERQSHTEFELIVAATRREGLLAGTAPYVVFLDEDDVPAPEFLRTLLQAQRATGADVVTCGVRVDGRQHFFSGDPGGLGAVANAYGNVALFRRTVLGDIEDASPAPRDPDWPLLARLAGAGARIVSIPAALVERSTAPGTVADDPTGALLAAQQLEHALPDPLRGAVRLGAGLAADAGERQITRQSTRRRRRDSHP
jgi:glycosyltransferase involved in cell wall biosynthesis